MSRYGLVAPPASIQAPAPGLAGHVPLNGEGMLATGPQIGAKVYVVPEWASMRDPRRVAWIRQNLIEEAAHDPRLAWLAASICREAGAPTRDGPRQAAALLAFVQKHTYYANEKGERLQAPWVTLEAGTGDCDDLVILLCSMAESLGLGTRMVLYGRDGRGRVYRWCEGRSPGPPSGVVFEHIYCELGWPALNPRNWASCEPTIKNAPLGYDVAFHGVQLDRDGRVVGLGSWGQQGGGMQGQVTGLSGVGAWGGLGGPGAGPVRAGWGASTSSTAISPTLAANGVETHPSFFQTLFSPEYLRQLSLAVVEGVAVAVATWAILKQVQAHKSR